MQIVKGKLQAPVKAVIYGPEGIGKSSLATKLPKPLFIDLEHGTNQLDVERVHADTLAELTQFFDKWDGTYKTLVIDTADWMEKLIVAQVCMKANKSGIEEFGYGKGWVYVAEEWKRLLDRLALMQRDFQTHIVFLAHAQIKKFEQPDEMGAYDRWELKLSKTASPLLKEWCDMLLFLNYKTLVVEGENGKFKAQGGRRVVNTTHHSAWDAKNRFAFPEEIPLPGIDESLPDIIASVFSCKPAAPAPAPKPESRVIPPREPSPEQAPKDTGIKESIPMDFPKDEASPEKKDLLAKLKKLMTDGGITKEQLVGELSRKGVVPADTHPKNMNEATLKRVIAGWSAITHNIQALNNKTERAA